MTIAPYVVCLYEFGETSEHEPRFVVVHSFFWWDPITKWSLAGFERIVNQSWFGCHFWIVGVALFVVVLCLLCFQRCFGEAGWGFPLIHCGNQRQLKHPLCSLTNDFARSKRYMVKPLVLVSTEYLVFCFSFKDLTLPLSQDQFHDEPTTKPPAPTLPGIHCVI